MKIKLPQIRIGIGEIILLVIFAAALATRIFWIYNVETIQMFDFANYQMLASNIAQGYGHTMHGLPVAWQGSGYPYVLGLFYWLLGTTDVLAGFWLNIGFSMGTLLFCWFIFIKIFDEIKSALAALAVVAFLPQYIAYTNVIGTEIFFTFILSALIFIQLYFLEQKWGWVALGLLVGAAALTRPFMLAYPVIAGVFMLSTTKRLKQSLAFSGIILGIALVVIAPWAIRNYRHFERLIPVSYNSGYVLFINNNDINVDGLWLDPMRVVENEPERLAVLQEGLYGRTVHQAHELEPHFSRWAREWIWQNPGEYLKLGILRVHRTFFDGSNDIFQWAANVNPMYQEGITEHARLRYTRNHNFLEASADIITFMLTGTGFLFMFVMLKKYVVGLFTKNGSMPLLVALVYINFAFFIAIPFFFEGQARYAFPAYLFIIPAVVFMCEGLVQNSRKS
ncbi:MAG: glycosyltransferase family 39 protein [Defluviitaleaceae bacterium]|nr:glycosyltransferase family 39 protein [Defluviitaleaceae bacterium]